MRFWDSLEINVDKFKLTLDDCQMSMNLVEFSHTDEDNNMLSLRPLTAELRNFAHDSELTYQLTKIVHSVLVVAGTVTKVSGLARIQLFN